MSMDLRQKPKTSDGRDIFLSSRFRGDVDPYFAGISDDPAGGRANGDLFVINWDVAPTDPEDKDLTFGFNDWVYLAKGTVRWTNAGAGDHISFKAFAPKTTLVANAGSGNCNLVEVVPGFNAIVAASGDGSHDYSDPIPVPAYDDEGKPNGHWLWSEPDEGKGDMTFKGDGKQGYNLYDIDIDLVRWIAKLPLIGSGVEELHPETKARKVLPHWRFRVDIHNESEGALGVTWHLDCARKKTT